MRDCVSLLQIPDDVFRVPFPFGGLNFNLWGGRIFSCLRTRACMYACLHACLLDHPIKIHERESSIFVECEGLGLGMQKR